MQFIEKQERQVFYRFEEDMVLEFEPIFDKMILEEQTEQIAVIFPRGFFYSENDVRQMIDELSIIQEEMQKEFETYLWNYGLESYGNDVIAIEGYYKKCYQDFEEVYNHDVLIILYLIIRSRKNIDGIKSLIKVGEDYEL